MRLRLPFVTLQFLRTTFLLPLHWMSPFPKTRTIPLLGRKVRIYKISIIQFRLTYRFLRPLLKLKTLIFKHIFIISQYFCQLNLWFNNFVVIIPYQSSYYSWKTSRDRNLVSSNRLLTKTQIKCISRNQMSLNIEKVGTHNFRVL